MKFLEVLTEIFSVGMACCFNRCRPRTFRVVNIIGYRNKLNDGELYNSVRTLLRQMYPPTAPVERAELANSSPIHGWVKKEGS